MFADAQALIGQTIADYRLLQILGQGGMGAVFLAQHPDEPGLQVAIKVLLSSKYSLAQTCTAFQARFMREARTMSLLQHQHIIPVLSYGKLDDLAYIVMPYLPGGTLSARLKMQRGSLPLQEVNRYLHQLANALDYAHQQSIVHRDIKPANVLLSADGDVSLTDFGIARFFESDPDLLNTVPVVLTATGEVFGTPSYMAPEIFNGELAGPAADIYALGVMLYQLVTGRLPFQGKGPLDVGIKHLSEIPLPPRSLRPELPEPAEVALLHALAKSPADRFTSAGAFADAFGAGLKGRWTPATSLYALQLVTPATQVRPLEQSPMLHSAQSESAGRKRLSARPQGNVKVIFAGLVIVMVMLQALVAGMVLGARNLGTSSSLSALSTDTHKVVASTPIATNTSRHAPITAIPVPSPSPPSNPSSYITVYNDPTAIMFAVSNNTLYALNKDKGTVVWNYITNGPIIPQPDVVGSAVYIVTGKGRVYALNITSGALLWSYSTHVHVSSPLIVHNGIVTVYADNGNSYELQANSGRLFAMVGPTATPPPAQGIPPTPSVTSTPEATPSPQDTPTPQEAPTPTPGSAPQDTPTPGAPPEATTTPSDAPSHTLLSLPLYLSTSREEPSEHFKSRTP